MPLGGCCKEKSKGHRNFLRGCKEGGFEYIRMQEKLAYMCWPQAAWRCSEWLVIVVVISLILNLFLPHLRNKTAGQIKTISPDDFRLIHQKNWIFMRIQNK